MSPALYKLHKGRFMLQPGEIAGDPNALDKGERESVRLVLEAYGDLTAHQLSLMTHREQPWPAARRRGHAGALERSTAQIHNDDIYEYFDNLTSASADEAAAEA